MPPVTIRPTPPLCALGIERRHAVEAVFDFFQADVHGAHEHPVGQGGKAQIQGGKQVGIGSHGVFLNVFMV
jgi:hypothetical protein